MVQTHAVRSDDRHAILLGLGIEQLAFDGFGCSAALADGRSDQVEPCDIAARPDAFDFRGALVIHLDPIPALDQRLETAEVRLLADGRDDGTGGDLEL